jgi:hypothetical protein
MGSPDGSRKGPVGGRGASVGPVAGVPLAPRLPRLGEPARGRRRGHPRYLRRLARDRYDRPRVPRRGLRPRLLRAPAPPAPPNGTRQIPSGGAGAGAPTTARGPAREPNRRGGTVPGHLAGPTGPARRAARGRRALAHAEPAGGPEPRRARPIGTAASVREPATDDGPSRRERRGVRDRGLVHGFLVPRRSRRPDGPRPRRTGVVPDLDARPHTPRGPESGPGERGHLAGLRRVRRAVPVLGPGRGVPGVRAGALSGVRDTVRARGAGHPVLPCPRPLVGPGARRGGVNPTAASARAGDPVGAGAHDRADPPPPTAQRVSGPSISRASVRRGDRFVCSRSSTPMR